MSIKMMPGKIAVEKLGKSTKKNEGAFFVPETIDSLGVIRHLAEDVKELKVGDQVYYGDKRQQIRMSGVDLEIMHLENIIAINEG